MNSLQKLTNLHDLNLDQVMHYLDNIIVQNHMLIEQLKHINRRIEEEVNEKLVWRESAEFWEAQAEFFKDRYEDFKVEARE